MLKFLKPFFILWLANADERMDAYVSYSLGDYNSSFNYFSTHIKNSEPGAAYLLGKMYFYGWGTDKNSSEAIRLIEHSSNAGNERAIYFLASYYSKEHTDDKSLYKAIDFYKKLYPDINVSVQCDLGNIYEKVGDYDNAYQVYWKASNRYKIANPTFYIARMHHYGRGRAKNMRTAKQLYRAAARKGSSRAQYTLGKILSKECDNPKSQKEAVKWLKASSKKVKKSREILKQIRENILCPKESALKK